MFRYLTLLIVSLASPSLAQSVAPADWDLQRNAEQNSVVAYSAFDNGLTIAVRCDGTTFQALIDGLPAVRSYVRPLRVRFPGMGADQNQTWNVAIQPTIAVSDFPAEFARRVRLGGNMDIVVPGGGEGGRNLRYVINLPASNSAVDQTLQACGRPLIDPRDVERTDIGERGLPVDIEWSRRPAATFPANAKYGRGLAVVSCLNSSEGVLQNCQIEAEYPQNAGFGAAALRSATRARLRNAAGPATPMASRVVAFRVNFFVEGYENNYRPPATAPTGSHLNN